MAEENSYEIAKNSTIFPGEAGEQKYTSFNANGTPIIKVVGVGGGGNNAVEFMYKQNIPGVSFVVANTDRQALINSVVPTQVLLGPQTTKGLGAGNVPDRARLAAEESEKEIAELFDEDTKMVFITAGMGGGTGTGASPVVARVAHEMGKLTIGIVTIPFMFEGIKKIQKALAGAEELSKYTDATMIINNERLTEIYRDLDFDTAFSKADETLTDAARSISELINVQGTINLDFADVETTLRDSGTAIISTGYGEGEHRLTKALEDALNSPLLKNRDVQTSKRFLGNIYYSTAFKMGEMDEMTEFMNSFANDVDVIWGRTKVESLGDTVKITILAAGFNNSISKDITFTGNKQHAKKKADPTPVQTDTINERISDEYGAKKVDEQARKKARANFILLTPEQMDNDVLISFFEKTPTFRRGAASQLRDEWRQLVESQTQTPVTPETAAKPAEAKEDNDNVITFE